MRGAIRKRPRLSIPLSSLVLLRLSAYSYLLPTAALSLSLSLSLSLDIQRRREQEDKQGVCRLAGAQEKIREFKPAVFLPHHSPLTTSIQSKVRRCRRLVVDAEEQACV